MSGLFGYVGKRRALPVLMQGLKLMDSFAFDSCGLLLKDRNRIYTKRIIGSVNDLERSLIDYPGQERMGAVHLRWATHGSVEEKNTHPIMDCEGKIAVMHKGMILNYLELKEKLEVEGHVFRTDTDSEVIAHLIEKNYGGDLSVAVRKALLEVDGTYGLLVFHEDNNKEMVVANAGMGMIIGLTEGEYMVALDERVLFPFTDRVIYLNDGEMSSISENGVISSLITGGSINVINKFVEKIKKSDSGLNNYFDSIEKEIFSQPEMVENILAGRIDLSSATAHFGGLGKYKDFLRQINRIVFVGSGSSFFAALLAKELIEDYTAIMVNSYSGLQFRYKRFNLSNEKTAFFVISQSGSTDDTVAALREARLLGVNVFGITNTVGSPVARETNAGVFLHSGPSLGMPSTRSFLAQLIALILLSVYIGRLKGLSPNTGLDILRLLKKLPQELKIVLAQSFSIREIVKKYCESNIFLVIGEKYCQAIARETALMLSEIGDVSAEASSLSEVKYGMINKINENFSVICLLPRDLLFEENVKMAKAIKNQGAKVIIVTDEKNEEFEKVFSDVIYVPKSRDIISPILFLMALQMFVFYLGKEKNSLIV
ncbi:MAG: glutamine--fructose-6-phosphate transaminase (isomerizing) [Patescibacteria group bacterium]